MFSKIEGANKSIGDKLMIISKSTCGLCKPTKKFKRNNTRLKSLFERALSEGELTGNLIKSYSKF